MKQFRYLTIPIKIIETIRHEMYNDFGRQVESSIASENSYGPCRSCLKQFKPGEKRLLFSYAPVKSNNPYNELGPSLFTIVVCLMTPKMIFHLKLKRACIYLSYFDSIIKDVE